MKKEKFIEMWSVFFTKQDKVDFINDLDNVVESKNKELIEENERLKKGLQTISILGKTDQSGEKFLSGIAIQSLKANKK